MRAAAPSLEGMGPDRYGPEAVWAADAKASIRPWNTLVLPEQHHSTKTIWPAFAQYGALLNGEYWTVEADDWLRSREAYARLRAMDRLVMERKGTGRSIGFYQDGQAAGQSWDLSFRGRALTLTATHDDHIWSQGGSGIPQEWNNLDPQLDGCGMLLELGPGDWIFTATRLDIDVTLPAGIDRATVSLSSGEVVDNRWVHREQRTPSWTGPDTIRLPFPRENQRFGQLRLRFPAGTD